MIICIERGEIGIGINRIGSGRKRSREGGRGLYKARTALVSVQALYLYRDTISCSRSRLHVSSSACMSAVWSCVTYFALEGPIVVAALQLGQPSGS